MLFGDFDAGDHSNIPILKTIDFGEATSDNTEFQSKLEYVMTALILRYLS